MWSPRTQRTTLNGPVPIGISLNGTRLTFLYLPRMCSGTMHTGLSLSANTVLTNGANLCLRWKTTVVRVRRVDVAHVLVADPLVDVVVVVHHRLPGELHVFAREWHAVLPLDARAQMIRDRQPVARDSAVGDGRHAGRQDRHQRLPVRLDRDERIEGQPVEQPLGRVRRQHRVEGHRLALDRNAQFARMRPGMP